MAHDLVVNYSLHRRMEIIQPFPASAADICRFHSPEYVDFLASVTPDTLHDRTHARNLKRFNVNEDCPVFDGLFSFCQASAGGSIGAAVKLNRQDADIAINWAGGLHHAKKSEASGFCYVNDIVLGILELLKVHRRVLYIDIDIHHGDGVEEAFYVTDRVMTVSFHKSGDFFPGTGHIKDIGAGAGKYYSLNVPVKDGINDDNFRSLFRPIIHKVMDVYQPGAIVLQCGADSLAGDMLGCFNLSVKGHADCLRFLRSFNVPLMVLGGGGYTICNVARCWCYETAIAVDVEPDNKLPYNEYYEYFGPDYTLHVEPNHLKNLNTESELEKIRNTLLDQLSQLQHVPSVPFQTMPLTTEIPEEREEDMEVRAKPRIWNGEEDYESDDGGNEKSLQRSARILQAGMHEKFQKKRKRGEPLAPMAPPSAQPSLEQPLNSDQATTPPPSLEQPEVEARLESTAAEIGDVSLRHRKGKKALAINVGLVIKRRMLDQDAEDSPVEEAIPLDIQLENIEQEDKALEELNIKYDQVRGETAFSDFKDVVKSIHNPLGKWNALCEATTQQLLEKIDKFYEDLASKLEDLAAKFDHFQVSLSAQLSELFILVKEADAKGRESSGEGAAAAESRDIHPAPPSPPFHF